MIRLLKLDENGRMVFECFGEDDAPVYAILSHTWSRPSEQELKLQDVQNSTGQDKVGYRKVRFCLDRAAEDGIEYCWVDSCCINKDSSAEETRAINSMFRWYQKAARCYVYLSDVSAPAAPDGCSPPYRFWEGAFRRSAWFTRGWTLQELLAPLVLEFFSAEETRLGDKQSLEQAIHEVTKIPLRALQGAPLSTFEHDDRRKWAASRQTTEPEDKAYCLLGILEVSMPSAYGEGLESAMDRLDEQCERSVRKLQASVLGKRSISDREDADKHLQSELHQHNGMSILDEESKSRLMDSLKFDQIDARHMGIKKAHSRTCQWLLQDQNYEAWIDSTKVHLHHGFIWIKGKPGSGKSTLMKFALTNAKKQMSDAVVLSFFFHARGHKLEKSTVGAFRAILVQLLTKIPPLRSVFENLDTVATRIDEDYQWSIETLKELLSECFQNLGPRSVVLFIDALDECDEQEVRDMIAYFEEVGEQNSSHPGQIRICLASRYYPHITIKSGLSLELDGRPGHTHDIETYLTSELRIGKSESATQIRAELLERSSGIFMWVVLVVGILNKEYDSGQMSGLQRRLAQIPSDLSALFRDIMWRDPSNKTIMLTCIQWILFAKMPLSPMQIYLAIRSGAGDDIPSSLSSERVDDDTVQKYILNASKGLAEISRSQSPIVQFIHESVRDFLLSKDGIAAMWPELADQVVGRSHAQLHSCCETYMQVSLNEYVAPSHQLDKAGTREAKALRASISKAFPFLEYASNHILYHADVSLGAGTEFKDFLRRFQSYRGRWIKVSKIFAVYESTRRDLDQDFIYIFAQRGCPNLLRKSLQGLEHQGEQAMTFHNALASSIQRGRLSAVNLLLESSERVQVDSDRTLTKDLLLKSLTKQREKLAVPLINNAPLGISQDLDLLTEGLTKAAHLGLSSVIPLLFEKCAELNARDTLFKVAIEAKNVELVKLILQKWASSMSMIELSRALFYAACGSPAILQLLLPLELGTEQEWRALSECCGYLESLNLLPNIAYDVCLLLVKFGATPNLKSGFKYCPLYAACASGSKELVLHMFDKGLSIDGDPLTAYHMLNQTTAEQTKQEVLPILLRQAKSVLGQDTLRVFDIACSYSNSYLAQTLLESDVVEFEGLSPSRACTTLRLLVDANWDQTVLYMLFGKLNKLNFRATYLDAILDYAFTFEHENVVQLLLDQGAHNTTETWWTVIGKIKIPEDVMVNPDHKAVRILVHNSFAIGLDAKAVLSNLLRTCLLSLYTLRRSLFSFFGVKAPTPLLISRSRRDWKDVCIAKIVKSRCTSKDMTALLEEADYSRRDMQDLGPLLLHACRMGEKDLVRVLLEMGVDANFTKGGHNSDNTALQRAAGYDGSGDIVRLLLERGADVNVRPNQYYGTPLYEAFRGGPIQNVKLLLQYGANFQGDVKYYSGFGNEKDPLLYGMEATESWDPRSALMIEEERIVKTGQLPENRWGMKMPSGHEMQLMLFERQIRGRLEMTEEEQRNEAELEERCQAQESSRPWNT